MKIRGKPDVASFSGLKRDPSEFLEGAKAEEVKAPSPAVEPAKSKAESAVPKKAKLVELPESLFNALKDRAYQDFKSTGRRVTETEIIIAALKQYLDV